jgi:hypothetical protein
MANKCSECGKKDCADVKHAFTNNNNNNNNNSNSRGRNNHTANTGWRDVDPSGNKMNQREATKNAREEAKEEAKWTTMTADEYKEFTKKNRAYGVERDGRNFRVKIKR